MALTAEELMEIMLEKQNKEIEEKLVNKLDDVRREMGGAIKVVSERQDRLENDQIEMKKDVGLLRAKMQKISEVLSKP